MRPPRRPGVPTAGAAVLPTVLAVVVVLVAAVTSACGGPVQESGTAIAWGRQAAPLRLGVTHGETSLAPSDPAGALARGRAVLAAAGPWQNQHLMGFGVLNPEPSPGVYDWSSLDTRMALIRATGGDTVLTLAGAPDWMKGGEPGASDFSRIEVAPLPAHLDDFAALCAAAVARYPQVRAVQVWNELKGFYDTAANRWDAPGYAALYDRVYRAVKAVRPDVAVGGPYVPLDSWSDMTVAPSAVVGPWGVADGRALDVVTYWLAHNPGADFLTVDGGTGTKDDGLTTDPPAAAEKFAALTAWLRARSPLPVWWAEFYPEAPDDPGPATPARAAATLEVVAALARAGAATALLWQPQESADLRYAALWTDTADADGGRPTALTPSWTWLAPRLAAGSVDVGSSPDGRLLAFRGGTSTLLVNTSEDDLVVDGTALGASAATVTGAATR